MNPVLTGMSYCQLHYTMYFYCHLHYTLYSSSLSLSLLAFTVHMDAPPSVTAEKRKQFCHAVALQTKGGGCVRHGVCVLCVRRGVRQGVESGRAWSAAYSRQLVMLSQRCV